MDLNKEFAKTLFNILISKLVKGQIALQLSRYRSSWQNIEFFKYVQEFFILSLQNERHEGIMDLNYKKQISIEGWKIFLRIKAVGQLDQLSGDGGSCIQYILKWSAYCLGCCNLD